MARWLQQEGKTALVGIQADEPTWSDARVVAEVQSLPAYLRWPTKANTVKGNCWITPLPTAECNNRPLPSTPLLSHTPDPLPPANAVTQICSAACGCVT